MRSHAPVISFVWLEIDQRPLAVVQQMSSTRVLLFRPGKLAPAGHLRRKLLPRARRDEGRLLGSRLQVKSTTRQVLSTSPTQFRPRITRGFHRNGAQARSRPSEPSKCQNSKIDIAALSFESIPATGVQTSMRTSAPGEPLPTSEIVDAPSSADCEPVPPSERPHEPGAAPIARHPSLEASPCSVSSPPPSSSSSSSQRLPLPSSTDVPSSSASGYTTTDPEPKGDPNLALFVEAIYLCRRFCKLVEEGRIKRRETAGSGREGGA